MPIAEARSLDIIQLYQKYGADFNLKTSQNHSMLMNYILKNQKQSSIQYFHIIKFLIVDCCVDLTHLDGKGRSAFVYFQTSELKSWPQEAINEIMQLFAERGFTIETAPLICKYKSVGLNILQLDSSSTKKLEIPDIYGRTILYYECKAGNLDNVMHLFNNVGLQDIEPPYIQSRKYLY